MGDELGAIHEDVEFDWDTAEDLAEELRDTADTLEGQVEDREDERDLALTHWEGRFAEEFDYRTGVCLLDSGRLATALRGAATDLDELARLAGEEQERRELAREWEAAQDDGGGGLFGSVPVLGDAVEKADEFLFGSDDMPEPPPPVEPPTIWIGDPEVVWRDDAGPDTPEFGVGSGGVSSAVPGDLDGWSAENRALDTPVGTHRTSLDDRHETFTSSLGWGEFDASSLLTGLGSWLGENETDAAWVEEVAQGFRDADVPDGEAVPDEVIEGRLAAAGFEGTRESVTFDLPVVWGEALTSGYADDPVNTASGNFLEVEHDVPAGGGLCGLLGFSRTYNSRSDRVGPFGVGWASWASVRLRAEPDGAYWVGPDGQEAVFPREGAGYGRLAGVSGRVVVEDDGLALEWFAGGRWAFDESGLPVSAERGPGTKVAFVHDEEGRLVEMSHAGGRSLRFDWDRDRERVVGLVSSDGRTVTYRYDGERRLVAVEGGPGRLRRYEIDDSGLVGTVVDADGVVEVRNTYDDSGRVVEQVSVLGRGTRYRYLAGGVTIVDDDAAGPVNSYVHDDHGRLVGAVDGHGKKLTKVYDRWGNPTQVTERDGSVLVQEWDERARLVRRQRADGSWFSFDYDELGRVLEVTASTGATTRFTYQGDERTPAEIVDPEGGVTRLEVEGGLVRRVVDPDGVEVRFGFDAAGELTSVTDSVGNTAVVERDEGGRVTATVSPMGRRCEIDYDDAGRPLERRDPGGGVWRFEWTAAGRPAAVVDPVGGRRETRYGAGGEVEQVVDELGFATTRRFDVLGNVVGVVLADGAKWELGYDRLCRLTTISDPAGATWLRDYDVVGNLVGAVDPEGVHRKATVEAGRIAAVDDGLTSVSFGYDELGRAVAHRRPDGTEAHATYDRCGRTTSVTGPDGAVTRYGYSPAGRLETVTSPLGHVTRYEYDGCGRLETAVDAAGARWRWRYDGDGRPSQVVEPTGESTRFRYDEAGRLAARVASTGGVTRYGYDLAGRVVAVTDPAGGVTRYRWSPRGELVEAVDPNGGVVRYEHDARGLLTGVVDPLGGRVEYRYDPVGRLVEQTDQLGRMTGWEHDPAGRLVRRVLPTGEQVRHWYDRSGRVCGVGTSDLDGPVVEINRDLLGRPVEVTEPGYRHQLDWDSQSRLVAKRRNDLELTWRYDPDGRRVAVGYPDGTETLFDHDAVGRRISATHPVAGTVVFDHDAAGRLIGRTSAAGSERWRYRDGALVAYETDRGGQERVTELDRDSAGRVTAVSSAGERSVYSYDAGGQLVTADTPGGSWQFRYDAAGRLAAETGPDGEVACRYDAAHQLTQRSAGDAVIDYGYDAAGRRVTEAGVDGAERGYRWDWAGRLCGVDDTVLTVDAFGDLAGIGDATVLWDPVGAMPQPRWLGDTATDGSAIVGDHQPWAAVGADGTVGWYGHDWQHSVTGPAGPGAGTDPWGAALTDGSRHGGEPRSGPGYRGELAVDGLLWLRNRAYDPATRGFLSTDPLPGIPGDPTAANPYHYAGNNPINAQDPLGLRPMTDFEMAAYVEANADNGLVGDIGDWWSDNWEYVAAGALIVGGVVVMATGVGGPVGAAMIGGGMMAAGGSAGIQQYTTGEVDWGQVAVDGAIGAAAGGAGAWAGGATAAYGPTARVATQVGVNTTTNVVGGAGSRAYAGGDPFDPQGLALDTLIGAGTGGISAYTTRGTPTSGTPVASTNPADLHTNISGHGIYDPSNGAFNVPSGSTVNAYAPHGASITDRLGNAIETGQSSQIGHHEIFPPGTSVPNYTVHPPDGLSLQANPLTVTHPTALSDIVQQGGGNYHLAICLYEPGHHMSNFVFDIIPP